MKGFRRETALGAWDLVAGAPTLECDIGMSKVYIRCRTFRGIGKVLAEVNQSVSQEGLKHTQIHYMHCASTPWH